VDSVAGDLHAEGVPFPPRVDGPLAITHVTVVPMDAERVLPEHTVLIEDGRVVALAPAAALDVAGRPGVRVVDGAGRYLLPGLADMHVHLWDPDEALLYLAHGVTLVRNMWGHPLHLALERRMARGALPGPRVVTASPLIDGPGPTGGPLFPGAVLLEDPAQAAPLVRRYAARGYRQIKAYSYLRPAALRALGAAAAAAGLRLTGHCPIGMTFEAAAAAGMTCFEHLEEIARGHLTAGVDMPDKRAMDLTGAPEALWLQVRHLDLAAVRRLARRLAADQIWNCPTQVIWQQRTAPDAAARAAPWLRYLDPAVVRMWASASDARFRGRPAQRAAWLEAARAWYQRRREIVAVLHEEGAPLLAGTDAANPYVVPGAALHQELADLVAAGLRPYAALRCATAAAARFLGQDGEWGTVAPGARADLVLVGADPLADLGALRAPEAVFVNGFHLTRADLDRLLAERARAVQAPPRFPVALADLGPPEGAGATRREGVLRDTVAGHEDGRLAYRHRALTGGGWLLDECYVGTQWGPGRPSRRRARWWLAPDGTVQRGGYRKQTPAGEERCAVARAATGGYEVTLREVDGVETRAVYGDGPLVPGEAAAMTGQALQTAGSATYPMSSFSQTTRSRRRGWP
jgi:imidazolonepropionase-like amidohydrolase